MRTMHLFAGAGGGLLADLILGHTPVVAVEWEPYACQVLRERAADGWFPELHVWEGDVRLFDPSEYAGNVDCIHAGFPCQDISRAGNQAGVGEGTRSGLYREVLRIAGVVRPRYLFLENVSAILSNGLGTVLGDLAALGYDARWCCLKASDVGAPHHRDRWFALCTNPDSNKRGASCLGQNTRPDGRHDAGGAGEVLADAMQQGFPVIDESGNSTAPAGGTFARGEPKRVHATCGWEQWGIEPPVGELVDGLSVGLYTNEGIGNGQDSGTPEGLPSLRNPDAAEALQRPLGGHGRVQSAEVLQPVLRQHTGNIDEARLFVESAETPEGFVRGVRIHEGATSAPHRPGQDEQRTGEHPDALQTLSRLLAHGSEAERKADCGTDAVFSWWGVEPDIGRVANGVIKRTAQLKALGNAQVPLQAATAWRLLGGE